MSGSHSSSSGRPQLAPEQILPLYNQQLPNALATTYGQAPAVANTLATAASGANPIYTASGLQQLQNYAPGYQQAGANLAQQQAGSQADLIAGEGGRTAINADFLNRVINPNYYNTANQLAQSSSDLLSSFGRGAQLGGGELAAAERGINQGNAATGNLGNNNAMNTVANAMNFGEYARQKQQLLGNAIGQVNQTIPNMVNPTFNPVSTALNAGNVAGNFGLAQYNPTQANAALNAPADFGSSAMGALAGVGSTSQTRGSSTSAGISNICCFIFMEAYYGQMPTVVRKCRDRYYRLYPTIANGYTAMAHWLVPLMRRFTVVRQFVWYTMIKPLTEHGEHVLQHGTRPHKLTRKLWFTVWHILGR